MTHNTLTAPVAEPAHSYLDRAGDWWVRVDLALPSAPKRKPLVVRALKNFGPYASSGYTASRVASQLKRGMVCTVTYATANLRAARLELGGVDMLAPHLPAYVRPAK